LHFNAVDVIVLAALILLAIDGIHRGFAFYTIELFALGIGAAVALSTFGVVGRLFAQLLAVGQPMADLAASLLLLVLAHVVVQLIVQPLLSRSGALLQRLLGSVAYAAASVLPALAVGAVLTVLVVGGLVVVPSTPLRNAVTGSFVGTEVSRIDVLQRRLRTLLIPPARAAAQEESS
jgi:uncharacterized membrane protein required for colicin V production